MILSSGKDELWGPLILARRGSRAGALRRCERRIQKAQMEVSHWRWGSVRERRCSDVKSTFFSAAAAIAIKNPWDFYFTDSRHISMSLRHHRYTLLTRLLESGRVSLQALSICLCFYKRASNFRGKSIELTNRTLRNRSSHRLK